MRTIAPAKINWTLEVLGRRDDGYHEIRSVMQAIDLCDELSAERSDVPIFETVDGERLADDDLVVRSARALEERVGRTLPARIRLDKLIPVASGLGGGSSDAAAVIRLLDGLHELGLSHQEMAFVGARLGSDVPFFTYGGTALVEGRGDEVTPLPDVVDGWLVVLTPLAAASQKTAAMYAALVESDFGDGSVTQAASEAISAKRALDDRLITNSFDRVASARSPDSARNRLALLNAGARAAFLSGSGPGLFVVTKDRAEAVAIANNVEAGSSTVHIARTLTAAESTALTD